jgi:hypothetical protein
LDVLNGQSSKLIGSYTILVAWRAHNIVAEVCA